MRIVWVLSGLLALGLGVVGIVLPILPTVPFLLLATFCFARSSQYLHHWLISHPSFGPPILDWNENGVIHRPAKIWASGSVAVAFILSFVFDVKISVLLIQALVMSMVLLFIWTRPER